MPSTRTLAVLVLVTVLIASVASYEAFLAGGNGTCQSIRAGTIAKTQTSRVAVGAITEYFLPSVSRQPNAITDASDGSVWFAEQGLPGVGHLFPSNGTLVEYAWPGYAAPKAPDCATGVSVSGIAIWEGRVWGADEFGNAIVGLKPSDGSAVMVNTTSYAQYPYWVAVGPDGDLWFTSDNLPARLGRILPNMSVQVFTLHGTGSDEPLQLDFVNSSLAYLAAVELSPVAGGHVYQFNPSKTSSALSLSAVGPGFKLILPTSVAFLPGTVWVAQHDGSSVTAYDLNSKSWRIYPTSTVSWLDVTLPLEIANSNGKVWFNEHYANKIALLDPKLGTLTEYSESNPPAANYTQIQNDESIVASDGGLWVSSLSGGYVGFVDGNHDPGFRLAVLGPKSATLAPGGSTSFGLNVTGSWSAPMQVAVSDSENVTSIPHLIRVTPSVPNVPAGSSPFNLSIQISVASSAKAGSYTVAVTVTNGLIQQSAYIFIDVS